MSGAVLHSVIMFAVAAAQSFLERQNGDVMFEGTSSKEMKINKKS